ncbi:MAG: hypothetical protein ACOX5J_11560 [Candidatus Hydrogenedentales bacterium]
MSRGVRDCVVAAQPVFGLYGANDRLTAVYPGAEHDFPDAERHQAYACIRNTLAVPEEQ